MERSREPQSPHAPLNPVDALTRTYCQGDPGKRALVHLSLAIPHGVSAVLYGLSGSGTSTLHLIGGITRPTTGNLRVAGLQTDRMSEAEPDRFRPEHIGFVFQSNNLLPSRTALGLAHRDTHHPSHLSGGEQQRVAFARENDARPSLAPVDEPTTDLDSGTANSVLELISRLNQERCTASIVAKQAPCLRPRATQDIDLVNGRGSAPGTPR